jgi:1,4-dihydroxy-2-naphthoate octaprenyltransferase
VANNLRDVPTDAVAGKRTLAVRIGAPATRRLYVALLAVPFLLLAALAPAAPGSFAVLLAVPLAVRPAREVLTGAAGRSLVVVLGHTGSLQLVYALLLGLGLAAGSLR